MTSNIIWQKCLEYIRISSLIIKKSKQAEDHQTAALQRGLINHLMI
jgi:hypothetical protein